MKKPLAVVETQHASLELWPDCVATVFADGEKVVAAPNEGETILDTAIHEFLHTAVAEVRDDGPSHCLRAVADGDGRRWTKERIDEESLVYPLGKLLSELVRALRAAYPMT